MLLEDFDLRHINSVAWKKQTNSFSLQTSDFILISDYWFIWFIFWIIFLNTWLILIILFLMSRFINHYFLLLRRKSHLYVCRLELERPLTSHFSSCKIPSLFLYYRSMRAVIWHKYFCVCSLQLCDGFCLQKKNLFPDRFCCLAPESLLKPTKLHSTFLQLKVKDLSTF